MVMNQHLSQIHSYFTLYISFFSPIVHWQTYEDMLKLNSLKMCYSLILKFPAVDLSMAVHMWDQTAAFKVMKPVARKVSKRYQVFSGPCAETVCSFANYILKYLIQNCRDLYFSEVTLKTATSSCLSELDKHFMEHTPVFTVVPNSNHM